MKLVHLITYHRTQLAIAGVGVVVSSLALMAIPAAIGDIIDVLTGYLSAKAAAASATPGTEAAAAAAAAAADPPPPQTLEEVMDAVQDSMLKLAGTVVVGGGATYLRVAQLNSVAQSVGRRLRKRLFQNILRQEKDFFDHQGSAELANRLSTDVHEVAEHLVEHSALFVTASVSGVVASAYMFSINASLASVALTLIPSLAVGGAIFSSRVRQLLRNLLSALALSTQMATERFRGIATVKSFGAEKREVRHYNSIIDHTYELATRLARAEGTLQAAMFLTSNLTLLAVVWMGAHHVLQGTLSIGALASFALYSNELNSSLEDATEGMAGCLRAHASAYRIFGILEREPGRDTVEVQQVHVYPSVDDFRGDVEFRGVNFSYPVREDTPVLRDLTLTIPAGEHVAITGPSGCGKSTLLQLVSKLYHPSSGEILVDGTPLHHVDTEWWRKHLQIVEQAPQIFSSSVLDNITMGNDHCSLDEVVRAAKCANAHEFIVNLQHGYGTHIGERGQALSGGQRQRIAIARATVRTPFLMLLDEATASLDAQSCGIVDREVAELMQGRTVLTVTHDVGQMQRADRVLVLAAGRVVQDGCFSELIQQEDGLLNKLLLDRTFVRYPTERQNVNLMINDTAPAIVDGHLSTARSAGGGGGGGGAGGGAGGGGGKSSSSSS